MAIYLIVFRDACLQKNGHDNFHKNWGVVQTFCVKISTGINFKS